MPNVDPPNSEALNQAILAAALDCIITVNQAGRVVEWNPAAARTFGFTREQALGRTLNELIIPPAYREAHQRGLERFLATGEARVLNRRLQLEAQRHDGSVFPCELTIHPIHTDGGVYFTAYLRDLTERVEADAVLREREARYRALVEHAAVGVARAAPDGRLLEVNPAAEQLLGYSQQQLQGLTVWDVTHPDDLDEARAEQFRRLVAGEIENFTVEKRYVRANGQVVWASVTVSAVRDEHGKTLYSVGVLENITERKRAANLLVAQARILERVAQGHAVTAVLGDLARLVEAQVPAVRCAIYHLDGDQDGLRLMAAPSLPEEHRRHLSEIRLTANEGACVTAARQKRAVRMTPVTLEHEWAGQQELFRSLGLRGGWAVPILNRDRVVLGVLALYSQDPELPGVESDVVRTASHLASMTLEHERNTRSLRSSEQRYRMLLDGVPQIVWTIRPDGRIEQFNGRWTEVTGRPTVPDGDDWREVYHPEDLARIQPYRQRCLETGEAYSFEARLRHRDGTYRWFLVQSEPMLDPSTREVLCWVGGATDITAQKAAEQELMVLNATLEQRVEERTAQLAFANRDLEAFSFSVSHDLRAPVRHIQGFTSLLRRALDGVLNEPAERYLGVIESSSARMNDLIDGLLALSRSSRTPLHAQAVDLNELVLDVRSELSLDVEGRVVEWRVAKLPLVCADAVTLRQVLMNLLGNAVKYTAGREVACIEVGCESREGEHVLFVRDNGAGFDGRYAQKLFGVFQRLHRADEFEGTGVGLANVKRIVERHGGRVWAEGELGRGATFYFTLPARTSCADVTD